MEQANYRQLLKDKFEQYFQSIKNGDANDALKFRIQGFIQAGELLSIVNQSEASEIMEMAHINVYGVTIAEHKKEKAAFKAALKNRDESYFDIPACERR